MPKKNQKKELVFSVIIAKAPGRKTEVLESLYSMDYDKDKYEVLIEEGPNASENRNKAIQGARGEIMAIIDDDTIVDKSLFKNAEELFNKYKHIAIFGGPQLTPSDDPFFAKVSGYVLSSYLTAGRMASRYITKGKINLNADEDNLTSAICFVRKDVFSKIGYFNTKLYPGEDPEFFRRAKKNGFGIGYSPNLYVYHRRRRDLKSFCKQTRCFGRVRIKKDKINQDKTKIVFMIPSILLIYLIISPALIYINKLFVIPLLMYLTYILFSSVYISIKNKNLPAVFLIPIISIAMHLSYGLGLIEYLIKRD